MLKKLCEITPLSATNPECPYNCIGCPHCRGIQYWDYDDIEVECELENNE